MRERRNFERYNLHLSSNIYVGEEKGGKSCIKCKTSDISSAGAFFLTDNPLAEGTKVDVEFLLPVADIQSREKHSNSIVVSSGFVVRTEKEGMAVCFDMSYTINPRYGSS